MCNHIFDYSDDVGENYNPDGETLTGICRYCGLKQKSYGMRWAIRIIENHCQAPMPFDYSDYNDKIGRDEKDYLSYKP